jgi:SP family galactose:H+ symporter-like MFS transporter
VTSAQRETGAVAGAKALGVIVAALLAAGGGLIQGFDTGGISNASASIVAQFRLTSALQGVVTSMVLVGAMIGSAIGGLLADKFGRRTMLIACGATFCAGVLIELVSSGLLGLLSGRVIAGLAIGIASCVSTLYISEISPAAKRGGLLSFFQLAVTIGIVCGILIALMAGQHPWTWRILLGAGLIPGLILVFGMLAMPETPAWLHHAGREDSARAALLRLRPPDEVEAEFQTLKASTEAAHSRKSASSAFASPALRLALVAGVGLALIQQITGINAVMYYAPSIFMAAGFTSADDAIADDLLLALLLVIVTFIASRLVDRLGRRTLMLWGLGGMVFALIVLGTAFAILGRSPFIPWLILAGLLLYIAGFALGPGPCIWLVIAEIYPLEVRGPAMSIATLASWLANLFVSSTFPAFSHGVGESNAFYIFCLVSILSWLFTWSLLPETSGRTLDEVQEIWRERAAVLFRHHHTQKSKAQ